MSQEQMFSHGDVVIYPSHGVGQIKAVENQEIAGHSLQVFVISFDQDRMTLRLPVAKAKTSGLRRPCSPTEMNKALTALKKPMRLKKISWAKRMQEYENKVNSGDPAHIAEVVRDLYPSTVQVEPSYSERQMYQSAITRLARELAAVEEINEDAAIERVESELSEKMAA